MTILHSCPKCGTTMEPPTTELLPTREQLLAKIERLKRPLLSLIETVEATGGVRSNLDPVGDPEWHDLGEAYAEACSALGCNVMAEDDGEDDRIGSADGSGEER